ncbi:MAG: hypothetical protein WAN14_06210 [Candidatus Acidiferrales bacterium]
MGSLALRMLSCALLVLVFTQAQTSKHEFDKNKQYVQPPVKAGDNGHLLDYDCIGSPCGWVHPCDAAQCNGHDIPVELKGNDAIWWGWSNSGDNCVLVFTVHYQ